MKGIVVDKSFCYIYNRNMKLSDYLNNYLKENIYPFHMPGNKRRGNLAKLDFTEVCGLDNLYCSDGILKEVNDRIKKLYKTVESYILVNGSTSGILTGITSVVNKGEDVLVARNCHKSVYNTLELWDLNPHYLLPSCDENGILNSISPDDVKMELEKSPDIKACIITSPTYEGVVSDIRAIGEICHSNNVVLIVDEAHGSHLGMRDYFPDSAVNLGADIVVHSTHKTLTSLTGTGILHICTDRVNLERVKKRYQAFQTSSPNYMLMASVDDCICNILENGTELFKSYSKSLDDFYKKAKSLKKLKIYNGESSDVFDFDKGKILILTSNTNICGTQLQKILRDKYKLETEMSTVNSVLAMTSINDTATGFERLTKALLEIDDTIKKGEPAGNNRKTVPCVAYTPSQAENLLEEEILLEKAEGRVSKEYIYAYPPGIPVIVPGEKFSRDIIFQLQDMMNKGVNVISERNKLPFVISAIDT